MARVTPVATEISRAKSEKEDAKERKQKRKYTTLFEEVVEERKKLKIVVSMIGHQVHSTF
jgi:hypothetical protein